VAACAGVSGVGSGDTGWREAAPDEGHGAGPAGVREKARLPDADETARQDVLDEAAEKRVDVPQTEAAESEAPLALIPSEILDP
jgi:hypothetical protein